MTCHTVADEAARLIEFYGTRDPFQLAEAVGAELYYTDLGQLKGMYTYIQNSRFIVLNNRLDEYTTRIVCAHELGHDRLHRELVRDSFLREAVLYDSRNRTEYEANLFAAELLLPDETVVEMAQEGQEIDEIAASTETDVNLVALKLSTLAHRGYDLRQFDYHSDFLKR